MLIRRFFSFFFFLDLSRFPSVSPQPRSISLLLSLSGLVNSSIKPNHSCSHCPYFIPPSTSCLAVQLPASLFDRRPNPLRPRGEILSRLSPSVCLDEAALCNRSQAKRPKVYMTVYMTVFLLPEVSHGEPWPRFIFFVSLPFVPRPSPSPA